MGGVSMEWKEVTLGEITNLVIDYRGKTPLKLGSSWSDSGYRALSAKNIKTGQIVAEDSIRFVDEELYKKWMKDEVERGDILITSEAPFGQIYYWDSDEKIVLSQRLFDVRLNNEVCHKYVYYFMTSHRYQKDLEGRATGTTVTGLRQPELLKSTILLPTLEAQRSIASILSSLDRKIELNNKINADLEEMAQAIFKNWFVDFEPFKDGKFVDSELGMIPEGWKVGCLGDLITIKYGKDHKKLEDGTFPVYGSGGFMRFVNSWLYDGESVLIPRKGTLDNIMYVCEKFWTVDTMFFSVPKMDYVMKYVYNYIKRFDFSKMNEGTSVPSNTAARLNKMPILIPTHEILEMYDETLCPIYNKRKMKDKESRILSLLRDTLLPRLMSGELEVPE